MNALELLAYSFAAGIIVLVPILGILYGKYIHVKNPPIDIHFITKDRKVYHYRVKALADGQFIKLPFGDIVIDPRAVYRDTKTGRPVAYVYAPYAAALPAELAVYAKAAKDAGHENIDAAEQAQFVAEVKQPVQIHWHEVTGFFKYNVSPAQVRYIVLKYVKDVIGKKFPWKAAIAIAAVIAVAGVLIYFLMR